MQDGSPDALRDVLGYLPRDFGVYPNLNALEFLEYLAAVAGPLQAPLRPTGFARGWYGLVPWLAGAVFLPSLALALGVWSGSGKPFEAALRRSGMLVR